MFKPTCSPACIALVYAVLAGVWIAGTDALLPAIFSEPLTILRFGTFKGLLFVIATGAGLYIILRWNERSRLDWAGVLQSSEERFRRLAENAPDLIYRYRLIPEPGFEYVSPVATVLTGYTPEEHYADPDLGLKIVHPDDREILREARRTPNEPVVLRWIRKDGTVVWTEQRNVPIIDENGSVVAIEGIARDVTDRKLAEKAHEETMTRLTESESRFRTLTEDAGSAILIYQGEHMKYVNRASERLLGYRREEILSMKFWEMIHPDEREMVRQRGLARQQGEAIAPNVEVRVVTKKGEIRWVDFTASVIEFEGKPAVLGTAFDITRRKEAEETMVLQSTALNAAANAIVITDPTGTIQSVNPAFTTMTGYSIAEAIGRNPRDLVKSGQHDSAFYKAMWDTLLAGQVWKGQIVNRTKDGRLYTEEQTITPVVDTTGAITNFIAIKQDVTQRNMAEQRIHEQAALLDNASDGIIVRDLENRVLYWNKGAERMYGWSRDEVMGRIAAEFLYSGVHDHFAEICTDMEERGEWEGELEHATKSGRPITVGSRWTLMRDESGNPRSILAVNTDITERKALEAQIFRSQRLESLGTLAGGIAHDLNNVLAPILLSFESLKRRLGEDERVRHLLSVAEQSAQRGKQIIGQVLAFARGIEGAKGRIQLRHLIHECEQIINETFPKSVTLRTEVPKDLWDVAADATQMHQVCMNLCVNARDAMPQGGMLRITASNILLDEEFASMRVGSRVGPYVVVSVSDTGMGIPKTDLERIFDPFFTTKEVGKGTGLGLSTVHAIVKGHGGFVDVTSRVGVGTTFSVYLPAVEVSGETKDTVRERFMPGDGELILVVDDEASIRDITSETLQMFGYRVVTASNGVEAVAQLAKMKDDVDLVLMDLMMPVMDGPAAIRAIRRLRPDIRVIASSGIVPGDGSSSIEDLDVQAFLGKPYTAERLLNTIHEVVVKGREKKGDS